GFPSPTLEYAIQSRAAGSADWASAAETAFFPIGSAFTIPPGMDGQLIRARIRATNTEGTTNAYSAQRGPVAGEFVPTTLLDLSPSDVTVNSNGDVTAIRNN